MDSRIERFFQDLKGKSVAFIGIGVSHRRLIRLFVEKGAGVTLCDKRDAEALGEDYQELSKLGISFSLGEGYLDKLDAQIIFRSPGVSFFLPALEKARQNGSVVTSEMEVFFDLCPCAIFGVTGSDGKTTTTSVIGEFFKASGKTVHVGGNIGAPLLYKIGQINSDDVAVVELSSFQLISMRQSPDVAVITNVTPNHLDVHKDMAEYIGAKKNLFYHQNAFSRTVVNADNEITNGFLPEIRGESVAFSRKQPVSRGAYLGEDGFLYMADKTGIHKLFEAKDIRIPGVHNIENYLAAISAVWGYVEPQVMQQVARDFPGVPHRIEFIREFHGVRWYNDSIASSPTRTIAGLNSFAQKVILIAGGYDKHIPFLPLGPKIIEKVKELILLGNTAEKIEDTVRSTPGFREKELSIIRVSTLEEAVEKAKETAQAGDIVTLSPACASFDMFPNFEVRGNRFKEIVTGLK